MYTPKDILRSTKYGNNYWETFSFKLNRNIRLFSDLEYDNWVLIETNPNVKLFCEQPYSIKYSLNGRSQDITFDMWVLYIDGTQGFIEVKYHDELNAINPKSERAIRRTTIQKEWCLENGFNYWLNTDLEIRKNKIYLNNLKQVISFIKARSHTVETDYFLILKNVSYNRMTISEVLEKASSM